MLTRAGIEQRRDQAMAMYQRAGIFIKATEGNEIEIADFSLGHFQETGIAVLVYVNTTRCCAKELVMWPGQTGPEHRHPEVKGEPGKEETFRVHWGRLHLYVPGPSADVVHAKPP